MHCTLSASSILVPPSEHGYFVASWWRTPLRHPQKLLLTNRLYFQQTSGIHKPVGRRRGWSLTGRNPAPKADSFHVATMARKHSVLNLREINRNNTHTALASVLTYYGWLFLICSFLRCNAEKYYLKIYNFDTHFLDVGIGSAVIRSTYERRSLETSYGLGLFIR
jgi:hypothetical protein